ncbi:MAG: hypothetical protein LBE34_02030 [Flavobacteriaceae bacterium]|jgi:hypothetical protein|nr:hypothetical protein [Flavobacteriaceae bacterium]
MKNIVLSMLSMIVTITGTAQEKSDNKSMDSMVGKMDNSIPFLTKDNKYIYVDKITLAPIDGRKYKRASLYTSTGYAIVDSEQEKSIVIDTNGREALRFEDSSIELEIVNGLTFYKKNREYKKKMPFWRWEWNILGGGIKKEQTYQSVEIGVVETKQILLQKEIPRFGESYYLDVMKVDKDHVIWNETIYVIKNKHLKKKDSDIIAVLEGNRFIKEEKDSFSIYSLNEKKALQKGLQGCTPLPILFNGEIITLPVEINMQRYKIGLPKVLINNDTKAIYAFPKYDKVFPKEIKKATATQIDFIKKTSLVYSITNTPYFLLGVFNYDQDVWAYSWLYIDIEGNVLDTLNIDNFKVEDQFGYMVWPNKEMILPNQFINDDWKVGKMMYYGGSKELYKVTVNTKEKKGVYGMWNSKNQQWDIQPEYYSIRILDKERDIFALQQSEDSLYILYDNQKKQEIGVRPYSYINSEGMVQVRTEDGDLLSYYIDIYTGKEYKED